MRWYQTKRTINQLLQINFLKGQLIYPPSCLCPSSLPCRTLSHLSRKEKYETQITRTTKQMLYRSFRCISGIGKSLIPGRKCASIGCRHIKEEEFLKATKTTGQTFCRKLTSSETDSEKFKPKKFTAVYRFQYIVPFQVACRLKLYQTGIVLSVVPVLSYMNAAGNVTSTFMYSISGIASLATVMLYVMGELFRRVVGILSVDESRSLVQISHLTFWGRRNDVIVNVHDIIPLSDMSENINEVFVLLKLYDSNSTFFVFHKSGILDEDKFWAIFG